MGETGLGEPAAAPSDPSAGVNAWPGGLTQRPVVLVDVETTGGRAGWDRVIDIGIVAATGGVFEYEWSTLVNPGVRIPYSICELTGITEEMIAAAPPFEAVAGELLARLRGRRHRALPDAQALWQFWRVLGAQLEGEQFETALGETVQLVAPPPHLPQSLPDEMPETPGVYLFHDHAGELLYVGKAGDIRQGVLDYWQLARKNARARRVVELSVRVEWIETTGAVGARVAQARLIEEHRPKFNKVSRALTRVWQESAA